MDLRESIFSTEKLLLLSFIIIIKIMLQIILQITLIEYNCQLLLQFTVVFN